MFFCSSRYHELKNRWLGTLLAGASTQRCAALLNIGNRLSAGGFGISQHASRCIDRQANLVFPTCIVQLEISPIDSACNKTEIGSQTAIPCCAHNACFKKSTTAASSSFLLRGGSLTVTSVSSLTHWCAWPSWPAEGRSVVHVQRSWLAIWAVLSEAQKH